jgi:short-subunit dehydrogenase
MTQLADKVVWITGASSGIGEALAISASRRGARLVLTSRREAELQRVKGLCADPAKVAVLPLDLTAFDASDATAKAAAFFGPVDILVNNAGWSQRGLVADTDISVYRKLLELDFFAPVALTRAVLPGMRQKQGGGHIVMIGSIVSKIGTPLRSGYCAAKHALDGFTEAARAELWKENIRFTFIMPGFIRTAVTMNALDASGGAHGKMDPSTEKGMEPAECAEGIWRAVEKNRDEAIVSRYEWAAVKLKRLVPGLYRAAVKRAKVT